MEELNKVIYSMVTDNNSHSFYSESNFERITWEDVIDNLNRSVTENLWVKHLDNYGVVTHDVRDLVKTYPIRNILREYFPEKYISSHLYASFTEKSQTFGKHNDFMPVLVWQCIGITRWIVYDEQTTTYDLKPGNLLYIPQGMYHETIPITPRASISYGIEEKRPGD